ncbi:putative serine/threonine protein kinase receptor [Megavirus vitis]|nr:putative serine/threonine protein kinase receptor [Megavirus vitis]
MNWKIIIILIIIGAFVSTDAQISTRIYGTGTESSASLIRQMINIYGYTNDIANIIYEEYPINVVLTQTNDTDFIVLDRAIPGYITDIFGIVQFPIAGQAIVMSYNIPELANSSSRIIVSRDVLARIWYGNISRWNDPAILALNANISSIIPDAEIQLGYNDDATISMTGYVQLALSSFSSEFAKLFKASGGLFRNMSLASDPRCRDVGIFSAGRVSWLKNTTYGLTFVKYSDVYDNTDKNINYFNMYNKAGFLVEPNIQTVQSAMSDYKSQYIANNFAIDIYDAPGNSSYPLSYINFIAMSRLFEQLDCTRPTQLLDFVAWSYTNDAASQAMYESQFYPLDKTLQRVAIDSMFIVKCNNEIVFTKQYLVTFGAPVSIMSTWLKSWSSAITTAKYYESLSSDAIEQQESYGADFAVSITGVKDSHFISMPDLAVMSLGGFGIVPAYNIPSLKGRTLVLDISTIVGIYLGQVTKWNDARIKNTNTDIINTLLPNTTIKVVVQTKSDINSIFTEFLSSHDVTFSTIIGTTSSPQFPVNDIIPVDDLHSVGDAMYANTDTFGFWTDFGVRLLSRTPVVQIASIQTEYGNIIMNYESLQNSIDQYVNSGAKIQSATSIMSTGPNTWPLSAFVSVVYRQNTMQSRNKAAAVADFIYWVQSNTLAINTATTQGYYIAAKNPTLMAHNLNLLKVFTYDNVTVSNIANCIYQGTICYNQGTCNENSCLCNSGRDGYYCELESSNGTDKTIIIILSVTLPIAAIFIFVIICVALIFIIIIISRRRTRDDWEIDFDELEMSEILGSGGYGMVHKATWKGTEVAVKVMASESITKENERAFRDEVKVMTNLRHPNVVLFMAACTKPPNMCIVMELMSLGSMYELIHNELIPEIPFALKVKMAYQASKGMHFLHSSGIVHRDLKSLNLLLDAKWNVKVSDFGLTKFKSDLESRNRTVAKFAGSIQWSAPEILNELTDIDYVLADVYSFGIILWELMTRDQPYADMTIAAIAVAVIRDNKRPDYDGETDIPPEYIELMTNCWHIDPVIRPTFLEIMTRLSNMIGDSTNITNTSSSSSQSSDYGVRMTRYQSGKNLNGSNQSSFNTKYSEGSMNVVTNAKISTHPVGEVAVVFTDIVSADMLWDFDAESMRDAMVMHNDLIRKIIKLYNGYESYTVNRQSNGEGSFCLIFNTVDDAVKCCENIQMCLLDLNWPAKLLEHPLASVEYDTKDTKIYCGLRVRMGIHYGPVKTIQDAMTRLYEYKGPTINMTARITVLANAGQVIISDIAHHKLQHNIKTSCIGEIDIAELNCMRIYEIKMTRLEGRFFGGVVHDDYDSDDEFRKSRGTISNIIPEIMPNENSYLTSADMCRWIINYHEIHIGKQIGYGSYGLVYQGEWKGINVAVKKFVKQKLDENQMLEFRAEMAFLSQLQHPNIVMFIGACVKKPNICIITEFMQKGSLRDVIRINSGKIKWNKRMRMLRDAARGIDYLHSSVPVIIHRDIKSSNILVDENDNVKVADFGFARIKQENATMTRCGTPCWTAPEIIRGEKYNEKADVFSFGVVMWEMVTFHEPFAGCNFMQVSLDIIKGTRPQIPGDCPPEMTELIKSCWHAKAKKRPTMEQVIKKLSSFIKDNSELDV